MDNQYYTSCFRYGPIVLVLTIEQKISQKFMDRLKQWIHIYLPNGSTFTSLEWPHIHVLIGPLFMSLLYNEVNIDPLEVFVYGVYCKNGSTFTSVYREVNEDPL